MPILVMGARTAMEIEEAMERLKINYGDEGGENGDSNGTVDERDDKSCKKYGKPQVTTYADAIANWEYETLGANKEVL